MTEFREIFVPIDFSEASMQAVEPAYSLTRLIHGRVFLMHVIDMLPRPNPLYAHYAPRESVLKGDIDKMEIEARTKLLSLVPKRDEFKGVETQIIVTRHVTPHESIVEEAEKAGADIIVMTHKGWSTLGHLLLGSTAEMVIRHARCAVMVIRAKKAA
jgi:nucleotide-binding universal stress UspA family protein